MGRALRPLWTGCAPFAHDGITYRLGGRERIGKEWEVLLCRHQACARPACRDSLPGRKAAITYFGNSDEQLQRREDDAQRRIRVVPDNEYGTNDLPWMDSTCLGRGDETSAWTRLSDARSV